MLALRKKLLAPGGPLGVFVEYPLLMRFAAISVCAEIAWATLIIVLQFHFQDDLFKGEGRQLIASRIATVTLAFVGCETVLKVPMGALSDRVGPRRLILFALLVSTISPILMTQATQWYHFVPLRAIDGIGAAALWPAMSSLMARSVPREAKAAAMSVFNGAYCLGLAVGPLIGLLIGHKYGNTRVFPFCSILMFTGFLVARSVLRSGIGDRVSIPASEKPHTIGEDFPAKSGRNLLAGRPMLLRMMTLYALSQCAVGMFANVGVVYLKNQFNIVEGDLPRIIAAPALLVALIALPLGRMADAIGRPRAVWISYALATIGMLMVSLTSLFEPITTGLSGNFFAPPMMLFGLGLMFLVASFILGTPAWLGLTSVQVDDSRQAQALSMMQTAQGVGVVVGSALVASAGHLLTSWDRVSIRLKHAKSALAHRLHPHADEILIGPLRAHDAVPISSWLWVATAIFALCLIGTLLYVREPEHAARRKDDDLSQEQPLEITGI